MLCFWLTYQLIGDLRILTGVGSANIIRPPINQVVNTTGTAVVACTASNETIQWNHYEVGKGERNTVVNKYGIITKTYSGKVGFKKGDSGSQDLEIRNVALKDAGTYECWNSFEEDFRAQLIVISKCIGMYSILYIKEDLCVCGLWSVCVIRMDGQTARRILTKISEWIAIYPRGNIGGCYLPNNPLRGRPHGVRLAKFNRRASVTMFVY